MHGVAPTPVDELNLEDGLAGTMVDKIVDYMQREKARNEALTRDQNNIQQRSHEVFTNVTKKSPQASPSMLEKVNLALRS